MTAARHDGDDTGRLREEVHALALAGVIQHRDAEYVLHALLPVVEAHARRVAAEELRAAADALHSDYAMHERAWLLDRAAALAAADDSEEGS